MVTTVRTGRIPGEHPTAGASFRVRCRLMNVPGTLAGLLAQVGNLGSDVRSVELIETRYDYVLRDVTFLAYSPEHASSVVAAMRTAPNVDIISVTDLTLEVHAGGKIAVALKSAVENGDDLARVYTPGVGRVAKLIAADQGRAWDLTSKGNAVAIVTDGSAVLGLGSLGPLAALPVMEGKAILFRKMAGIDAWPLCLDVHTIPEIVDAVCAVAPSFGAINLEDIAAPACFEVERLLSERLGIPVFHDDQHGTAIVVLSALYNAMKLTGQTLGALRVVICGVGAAGSACARLLVRAGVEDIIGVDREGIIQSPVKVGGVEVNLNPRAVVGGLAEAMEDADVLIGTSAGGLVSREMVASMRAPRIVFALANPDPEIHPSEIGDLAQIVATGRSDYPNQINNGLVFPGLFRGLLDCRARRVSVAVMLAVAQALSEVVPSDSLATDYLMPSLLDPLVPVAIAQAVRKVLSTEKH